MLFFHPIYISVTPCCISFLTHNLSDSRSEKILLHVLSHYPLSRTHITLILKTLHWFPVRDRIVFMLLLLVFHSLRCSTPYDNNSLIFQYNPTRCLDSSDAYLLVLPQTHNYCGTNTSFSNVCPHIWNKLLQAIHNLSFLTFYY